MIIGVQFLRTFQIKTTYQSVFLKANMKQYEAIKYDKKIYQWLLNKRNISTNSTETQAIIDQLPLGPLCGYFDIKPNRFEFNCVDVMAYTSTLYDMEYMPIYNCFDEYVPYDGHDIEDYTN